MAFSAGILNGSSLVIAFGKASYGFTNEIDVLRLPADTDPSGPFVAITNFTSDSSAIIADEADGPKNTGMIVGVAVGGVAFLIILALICWFWKHSVKRALMTVWTYLIWDPRTGEPKWTEASHLVAKLILFVIFVAYLSHNVNLVLKSPVTTLNNNRPIVNISMPDIRFCFEGAVEVEVDCVSDAIPSRSCGDLGYLRRLQTAKRYPYAEIDMETSQTFCWLFTPPPEFQFTSNSDYGGQIQFYYRILYYNQISTNVRIDLYRREENPNLAIFGINQTQAITKKSERDAWLQEDLLNNEKRTNRYTILRGQKTSISYKFQMHRYLKNIPWNKIGFAQKFDDIPELITTIDSRVPDAPNYENSMIEIFPEQLVETTLQEQRIYTVITALGPVAGLFSLLLTINNLLFGTRPKSPWGIVHRFSIGPLKASLRNQLRDKYGFLQQPTPYVNPVHHQFFDGQSKLMIDVHKLTPTVNNDEDRPHHVSITKNQSQNDHIPRPGLEDEKSVVVSLAEFKELQKQLEENRKLTNDLLRRTQLTELMNKAYYIDDELYQCLDVAHQEYDGSLPRKNNHDVEANDSLQQLRLQQQSRYSTKKKGFRRLLGRNNEEADSVRSSGTAWSEQILLEDKYDKDYL